MADSRPDGPPDDGPSLEMPSFSLRRRRTPPGCEAAPDRVRESRRRREHPAIPVSGLPAAAVTGVVVGGLAVLLAWLAGLGCSAVGGTSSCGGAAGLPLLLVGLVVLAWTGAVLLRLFAVAEAGSTSLLAVGILAVLVMVFLLGSLDEWWSAVAVPLASVAAYAVSWWVTTTVVDDSPAPEAPETHDVR